MDHGGLEKWNAPLETQPPSALHTTPNGLLHLPFDVRLQIYHHLIPRRKIIDLTLPRFEIDRSRARGYAALDPVTGSQYHYNRTKHMNSIFLLCRQTSAEALDVLYGDNIFKFRLYESNKRLLGKKFVQSNMQRMRRIIVTIRPMRGPSMYRFDEGLWSSLLPQLKSLTIDVDQVVGIGRETTTGFPEWLDRWFEWLSIALRCFASHLSGEIIPWIYAEDCPEIAKLFGQYLPTGEYNTII